MTEERLRYIRDLSSIAPLAHHTELIKIVKSDDDEEKVHIVDKLSAPIDEYGIPKPEIMIDQLLGQIATSNFIWSGKFDLHHLATPKADYTVTRSHGDGDIGSAFRGLSCLKIELPRQMHNFAHAVFELPRRPSIDVMRQTLTEVGQMKRLHEVIGGYFGEHQPYDVDNAKVLCVNALHGALETMKEPELGFMPELETLANSEFDDIQQLVSSALLVRRFSRKHLIHPAIRNASLSRKMAA